jgi:hypothetical protein
MPVSNTVFGPASQQAVDQRRAAGFANRNGMYPDQFFRRCLRIKTVALAKMVQILRLLAATPQQAQPDQWRDEIEKQRVGEARHQASTACNSPSTASAAGIWALPPRLR